MRRNFAKRSLLLALMGLVSAAPMALAQQTYDATAVASQGIGKLKVKPTDWPQWGGSPERNNVPDTGPLPVKFDVKTGKNIRWSMPLGSETYGNPVVANGKA
ncbi:MAG: hypothetical protein ACK52S_00705, partial [Pirellula sp.]